MAEETKSPILNPFARHKEDKLEEVKERITPKRPSLFGVKKKEEDIKEKKEKEDPLAKRVSDILKEYDHKESDIPLSHDYWKIKQQLRKNF